MNSNPERERAFAKAIYNDDGNAVPLCEVSFNAGWQARATQAPAGALVEEEIVQAMAEHMAGAAEDMVDFWRVSLRPAYTAAMAKPPTTDAKGK